MEVQTCKREVVIVIPPEAVRRESDAITAQYQRVARIPGFRPGHAPSDLVRRRYREDIKGEVAQALVPKYFDDEIKKQGVTLAARPHFEEVNFGDSEELTCKATFEVLPEFEVKDFKGLEVEQSDPNASDAEVEEAIRKVQDGAATFEIVEDRGAKDGDTLTVHYTGRSGDATGEQPITARDAEIRLGEKGTVPEFSENLRSAKAGDVRSFDVTYPADHPRKAFAGKTFHYRVEVTAVRRKVVPELNDDLAKSASEYGTLDEFRKHLREQLADRKKRQVEAETRNKLVQKLVEAHSFPVPDVLVERQLDRKIERVLTQLVAQGIDPRNTEVDWRKYREDARLDAEHEVRAALILEKIADTEGIKVSEEELDDIIRRLAEGSSESTAALKTRLTRDGDLDRIKSSRRSEKALDLIYQNATIKGQQAEGKTAAPSEG